jgi:DNA-binding HxlR family transcriptional regulator
MSRCRRCEPLSDEVRAAAELLERRWLLSIVCAALAGARRFNELAESVPGISARMLAERLRDLEAAGLVERVVLSSSPPGVEYRLTHRGRQLAPVIDALQAYASRTATLTIR